MKKQIWKQTAAVILVGAMLLSGCGTNSGGDAVSVQAVSDLMMVNVSGVNRYSGVVEASAVQKVTKSSKKDVAKCYVKKGDVVKKGDALFRYDTTSLELEIESMELELEQMQSEINSYTAQIAELTKEREKASANKKLSYSLEIQETELDRSEAEYNLKKQKQEYEQLKKSRNNTVVHAKISGVVQSVDSSGDSKSYIVIRANDSYRVKGTVSELNIGSLAEGDEVQVISRIDENQVWNGTISEINQDEAASQDEEDEYYSDMGGETTTKYHFYVDLDNSDQLLMGQHVYIQAGKEVSDEEANSIPLSSAYLVEDEDGSFYVWAATARNKLEKRMVTVGDYDEYRDTYSILDGLTEEDYIAFPEEGLQEGEKTVRYEESEEEVPNEEEGYPDGEVPAMGTDGMEE